MAKPPKLDHVKYVRAHGRLYAYFNTGQKADGRTIYAPLGSPSAPDFLDRWVALKGVRTKRQAVAYTLTAFLDDFMASADYKAKAKATQNLYRIQLTKLTGILGSAAANRLEPEHVRRILDGEGWGIATQNAFVGAIGALYRWGRRHGKTTLEPVRDFDKPKGGQHEPWPEDVLEAALKADNDRVRLAVHILYFTGLRIGDACAVRWGEIRDGVLTVTPTKTKRYRKTLYITLAAELRAELERTPKRGLTVMTDDAGKPLRVDTLREALKAFTAGLGFETVPHGLRKNAVNALLLAGCTIAEVGSITGQSMQVIEHYAARVNNRKLGEAAILKMDSRRNAK